MDQGFFTNYSHQPSQEEVRMVLDLAYPLWKSLISFIEFNFKITGAWSSWRPANSGWGLRFRRNRKALVAFYPQKNRFMAQDDMVFLCLRT